MNKKQKKKTTNKRAKKKSLNDEICLDKDGTTRSSNGNFIAGVAQETNKNGTCGPPTKYHEGMPQILIDYVDICIDEIVVREKGITLKANLPTVAGFCKRKDVFIDKSTFYEWCKKYPEFKFAHNYMKNVQEVRLVNGVLDGSYATRAGLFMMNVRHEMIERQKHEVESNQPVPPVNLIVHAPKTD